jgi:hypothetical protein
MPATIQTNKKTYITGEGLFALEFTILPATSGLQDLGLFVYKVSAGSPAKFNHVSNVVDLQNHPMDNPGIGNAFYRRDTVYLEFTNAFEAADIEKRIFSDLIALEKNMSVLESTYATDQVFSISQGISTDIT